MTDPSSTVSQDDRTMALLAYLLAIPTSFIVPLILYILKKDQSRFVAFHALQALIFEIAVTAIAIVSWAIPFVGPGIIGILNIVALIIAALAANRGEWYSYPVIGDFTKKQLGMS